MTEQNSEPQTSQGARQVGDPLRSSARRLRGPLAHTPLDRIIIDAVVDSLQGVAGALSRNDLIKAVDELVNLNGRRHQSFFHAGFRDALMDRPFDTVLPAESDRRARWYWAGAIQGLARSKSWDRIIELYESTHTVRTLGDGRGPASRMAGEHVAEALWKTGRASDLHVFVRGPLAKKPTVFRLLLEAGTESLRSRAPGVARNLFEILLTVGEPLKAGDPLTRDLPTVRRRMAHCLRLLGEHQGAENLLQSLLREESDPGVQAMVHADLGLLKGRFALLDEVRIPGDTAERRDLVDRLRAGEKHFRDAVASPDAAYASHGHYCMGVLTLADDTLGDDRFEVADPHLEKAHAEIRSNRDYPQSLIAQIELYLGIAKSQLLDAAEIRHAARLIVSGLNGAKIPSHFVASMIASLACSKESIEMVTEPLLESDSDDVLDALSNTEILETFSPIAKKLYKRGRSSNRRKSLAAADLRRALRGFLGVGDADTAREVLDGLEQHAFEGSGVSEFLHILSDGDLYEPAWNQEDAAFASVRCLEAKGDFGESLAILIALFHRYITQSEFLSASGVLDQIETYDLDQDEFTRLKRRYELSKPADDPVGGVSSTAIAVRILVVGGDETQAKNAGGVATKLAARDPHVAVEFLHTGWGSNWNQYLDAIESRIANCDAVVVMRLIRTQLGRHARAMCRERNIPWRPCGSGGQGGQLESILTVAGVVREGR